MSLVAAPWVVWLEGTAHSSQGVIMDGAKMLSVTTCNLQQHFPWSNATGWLSGHWTGSGAIMNYILLALINT